MADQMSEMTGGTTSTRLGSLTVAVQDSAGNFMNTGQGILDRWLPREKRESIEAYVTKFATQRPKMAAFIVSQIALSGLPLALFVITTITVAIFALLTGILVGLIGALIFITVTVGMALCFLLPTLFFTTSAAVFIFLWGLAGYYVVKWFSQESVPGVHEPLREGIQKKIGLEDGPALNGETPSHQLASIKKHTEIEDAADEKGNKSSQSHQLTSNDKLPYYAQVSGNGTGFDLGGTGREIHQPIAVLGVS